MSTQVNVTTPHMYDHPERGMPANDPNALGRAIVSGKMPETYQINNAIENAKLKLGEQSLPHYGQRTADDIRTLLEDMQMLLETKNQNDVLQHFLQHSKLAAEQARVEAEKAKVEAQHAANQAGGQQHLQAQKANVQHKARGVAESLKTVVTSLANSKDFRALLLVVVELLQVTASQQNPNGLLDRVIDPLRRDVESDSDRPLKDTLLDVKNQAQSQLPSGAQPSHGHQQHGHQQHGQVLPGQGQAILPGQLGYQEVAPHYTGANTFPVPGGVGQIGQPTGMILPTGTIPADAQFAHGQQHVQQHNVPQLSGEHHHGKKHQTPQQKEKTNQIIQRFNALWTKAASDPQMKEAIESLLEIFDDLKGSLLQVKGVAQAHAGQSGANPANITATQYMWRDVHDIISQWTGRHELDQFIHDARELAQLIQHDQQLTQALWDVRQYAESTLQNPELLKNQQHQERASDHFHELSSALEKWVYNSETDYVLEELSDLINAIINDDASQRIRYDVEQFARNLVYNDQGEIDFRVTQEILESMRQMVLPVVMQQISGVPLPRIEGTDEAHKTDFAIDNLLFPGGQLMPEAVRLVAKEKISMDSRISAKNRVYARIKLDARRFDAHLENVNFQFHKHGALGMRDNGLMDVRVGGENARITVTWIVLGGSKSTPGINFQVERVLVHLDQVHIKIKEARHDVLLPLATKLFSGIIKTQLERSMQDKITQYINRFDAALNNAAGRAITQAKRLGNQRATRMRALLQNKANQLQHRAEHQVGQTLNQPSGPHQVDLVATKNRVATQVESLSERARHQARKAQHELNKNQAQPAGQLQPSQFGQQQQQQYYTQPYTGQQYQQHVPQQQYQQQQYVQPVQPVQQFAPHVHPVQSTRDLVNFDSPSVPAANPAHNYQSTDMSGLPSNVAGLNLNSNNAAAPQYGSTQPNPNRAEPFTDDRTIGQASTL